MAGTPSDAAYAGEEISVRERAATPGARPVASRRRAPLPVAAVVAALWAAMVSYAPVAALSTVGAWASGGSAGAAVRLALGGWLLGHAVPLTTSNDRVTLVPLAVTALAAWRIGRAGVHASRVVGGTRSGSLGQAMVAATAVAVAYTGIGAAAAALARSPALQISVLRAAVSVGCFGLFAAAIGACGQSRATATWLARAPRPLIDATRTGLVASALMVATGAVAAGAALAVHGAEAAEMLGSYRAGVLGQAGITVLCLAYAPNLAVWAAAYLLGPGFAVGAGTVVSPGAVVFGPMPAMPAFAAFPSAPATGWWALLLGAPVIAAIGAGALWARRIGPHSSRTGGAPAWTRLLGPAVLAGPVAGLLMQLAGAASAGALGSGRLTLLGPSGWRVFLVATMIVTAGAPLGAAAARAVAGLSSAASHR